MRRTNFPRVKSSVAGTAARWLAPFLAVAAVVAGVASPVQAPQIQLASEANPLVGKPFYVDPISKAMRAAQSNPSPQLDYVANTPQAYWLDQAFPASSVGGTVSKLVGAAQAAGATPVLSIYALPHRDCYSYAAGGFGSADGYRAWIDAISAGLGSAPAAIILEPDALAMADCLTADQRAERFDLIRYAVDTLTRDPAAAVYIDAGHSRWVSADKMAAMLNDVGVARAQGFSLNTTNYYTTEEQMGYGNAISGMTGGSHYVIDTSRNGRGPESDSDMAWCNPKGRALGVPPTTATGNPNVDAFLWVKRVGESDGSCGRGEPGAGTFVNQYAIDLALNAGI
nr:glycoside hydrolase family 6 protein [Mycolicibacterium frederiksbergense]